MFLHDCQFEETACQLVIIMYCLVRIRYMSHAAKWEKRCVTIQLRALNESKQPLANFFNN